MASEVPPKIDGQSQTAEFLPDAADSAPKPKQRSWRRKYRKMRAKFEDTMSTSNTLIKDEFRAMALARRLQEQNDQILEMLLDMNDAARLPANFRFDLRLPSDTDAAVPEPDPEILQQKLQELRTDLASGTITTEEYAQKSEQLHNPRPILSTRTLAVLLAKVPHTSEVPNPVPDGLELSEHAPGYMSPSHEEEYLHATDLALADPTMYDPNSHDGRPLRISSAHPIPNEKDLTIRNPDSVYNWLRKHQPQVFLQDKDAIHHENTSEKSSARPGNASRGGKRQSAVTATTPGPKIEHELPDEEQGFIPESGTAGGPKGKKGTKEDDGTYRPKGGSSRAGKRKREEGETPVPKGRGKKNRVSGGAVAS
ncbi:hypothetical protein K504DRAFT_386408 [Pleomassaria siparia CBS 279.74]|uniref:IEC3 subunit of the Ino80 complex, chromatin re-modelling-domain-containing protein n=1 Tax=Pleomassaria siparia CBS 279.74 TaxID=1314801 RepID=A0A6G1K1H0_9PLEO|nr:hypothetical protein K504DRAFT_386408 [Pleomassaria siparia CBS 279.74]